MKQSVQLLFNQFLGDSPSWYKTTILSFLVINPIIFSLCDAYITGWCILAQFIFTLAMALKCYPLMPGGLLAIESIMMGITTPDSIYQEAMTNFDVILLLMFMIAGIYFLKDLLLLIFTSILIRVKSKTRLSLMFTLMTAIMSAFLDALTVTAVLITVASGFYMVYHKHASIAGSEGTIDDDHRKNLWQFRAFLRSLLMHGVVGTALGGVCTLVGEPQNLLIANQVGFNFTEFFIAMAPITLPVLLAGLITTVILEKTRAFGYGARLPIDVRRVLEQHANEERSQRTAVDTLKLNIQILGVCALIVALAMHVASVGLIGLAIIILVTSLNGITKEHQVGNAFTEAMPFASLLVVFFAIVSIIHDQHLFEPITTFVIGQDASLRTIMLFMANGLLSMISDNVFVASVYIGEISNAFSSGIIDANEFERLAIAINTGTNIPSVATPNGQAAFLFLLTSAVAPLVRLSYGRMVMMAIPYTFVMTITAMISVIFFL